MNQTRMKVLFTIVALLATLNVVSKDLFPDGTPVPEWFRNHSLTNPDKLGKAYNVLSYGVTNDSTIMQTEKIQAVIDLVSKEGGGVVVIPKGIFSSGSLFFKPNTHLHLEEGAVLKGSDDISDFAILPTRMEGQNIMYFAALVNADKVDGFTITGKGTIDGNGLRYWKSFWLRRRFNPRCTNLDEMRPRLVFISNSKDVEVSGVRLVNSPFWTTHLYKCENVKLLNLYIFAPEEPIKAPSSDAIDIDVCSNVLVKNCYISVNDDGVVLKGGKGPWADTDENNGSNKNIIIEDNTYGFCHSAFTCGSESVHNHNVIFRRSKIDNARRVFQLKMRPDTPQNYNYITLDDISGNADIFIDINPWTQFFDLKGEKGIKMSYADHITMKNIDLKCSEFFNVRDSEQYKLSNFTFENMKIEAKKKTEIKEGVINSFKAKNVVINRVEL